MTIVADDGDQDVTDLDVVVVGAGSAGLSVPYRLRGRGLAGQARATCDDVAARGYAGFEPAAT